MNNSTDREILEVYLDDILPNRFQPRLTFDQAALNELSDSIRQHGIIQPLVVRKLGDKYEIIAGERRYKAAMMAGLKKVPVVIMNLSDNESAEIAIVENIQRKEMTPLEEARSYKKLLDRGYLTQEQLATRMGKSQSAIANKLRLLNLSEEVQDALLHEKISERHARSLLSVKSIEDQKSLLNEIMNKKLTVKQTDDLIRQRFGITSSNTEEDTSSSQAKNIQTYASAMPFIPNPYAEQEPNPQLNLINQLNKIQPEKAVPLPSNNENNFDAPVEAAPPEAFAMPQSPAQNNVTELMQANIPTNNNINQPIEIDIQKLKQEAHDINQPSLKPADLTGLLKPEEKQVIPAVSDVKVPEQKENRFIFDFTESDQKNENINQKPLEVLDMGIEEKKSQLSPDNVQAAIDTIKSNIEMLKNNGIKVTTEEFDFEKLYQIIIKIDK